MPATSIVKTVVEMTEDYEERPVWLRKRMANYVFEDGEGHLFILDKARAAKAGLVDLASLKIAGRRCRTDAQSAWLIGPLQKENVPALCFLAHIKADRSILRNYAAELGKLDTLDQADGLWVREPHPEECDCRRSTVHQSHVSALHIAEAFLDDPRSFG